MRISARILLQLVEYRKIEKKVSNLELKRLRLLLNKIFIQLCFLFGGVWKRYFYRKSKSYVHVPKTNLRFLGDIWQNMATVCPCCRFIAVFSSTAARGMDLVIYPQALPKLTTLTFCLLHLCNFYGVLWMHF